MSQEIDLGGTIYISSRRAAEITGYAQDYIGQLARAGQIEARRVAGLWYVLEESLRNHKQRADEFVPTPPVREADTSMEASVSFDGKDYISAGRGARITGYSQDYVSQLARNGKVLSRQIGNRWYVDREGLVEHKRHNDSLLAAVQADSVGIPRQSGNIPESPVDEENVHFNYVTDEAALYPKTSQIEPNLILESEEEVTPQTQLETLTINSTDTDTPKIEESQMESEAENQIQIRVIPIPPKPYVPEPHRRLHTTMTSYTSSSRMTMFFIVFLVVVLTGIVGMGYVSFTNQRPGSGQVASTGSAVSSAATKGMSNAAIKVQDLAVLFFSKELEYNRAR